jgi:hypothetical protein
MSSVHAIPFTDTCGDCGHDIERPMPGAEYDNVHGIWVACGECGHRNWATKD